MESRKRTVRGHVGLQVKILLLILFVTVISSSALAQSNPGELATITATALEESGSVESNLSAPGDRELALVRRQIPAVYVRNIDQSLAGIGTSLFNGDTLRTDIGGYAMVLFMDQSVTRVRPESQLIIRGQVNQDQSTNTRIDVQSGEIFMNVNPDANSLYEVGTTTSVASVKGTVFGSRADGYHWVVEGVVEVLASQSGQAVTLTEGMFAQVSDDGLNIESGVLNETELETLETGYEVLDTTVIERQLRLRFIDENGEVREIEVDYTEQ